MNRQKRNKNDRIKIISFCIVGFLLVFSTISMVVVKFVYDGQFPRYNRQDETITAGLAYTDLEKGYPRQLVSFQSGNKRLQGYVYGMDQNQGVVVVVHGLGGGADSYLAQIAYFVDQGWRVFAYDATGSYDSEGKTTKGFPQALIDLDAALKYIETEPEFDNLPVMLFGHSWGGYAAANILHYDHDIAGVVSVSGANSPMDMIMEQGHRMMGDFIYIEYPYMWLYQRILFGKAASLNAVDAVNKSDIPVLIIHGTEDEFVSYNGASIIANIDKITNPNVKTISISETKRNGHDKLFRSDKSLDYIDEINIQYKDLYEAYNHDIPYEIKQAFYSKVDKSLAQDVKSDVMNEIQTFFMECLDK